MTQRSHWLLTGTLIALTAFLFASPARAWGIDGHKIVCAIAWDELTPAARNRVKDILQVDNRAAFAETCNWADDYTHLHPELIPWHFVDVPRGATAVDPARDCAAPRSCVVDQIEADTAALRHGPAPDPAATLKFLAHFVADVHQPLHAGYAEDRGGNDIKGTYFGDPTNLHLIWDYKIIEHDGRPWEQIADSLESAVTPAERTQWANTTPLAWANEFLAIALAPPTQYVTHGETFELGEAYQQSNLPVVLDRLKQAGVRLGRVLNTCLN